MSLIGYVEQSSAFPQNGHREAANLYKERNDLQTSGSAIDLAKKHIDQYYRDPISLDDLAALLNMSRFSFAKQFRAHFDVSPYQYVCQVRIRAAQSLIKKGHRPTQVAGEVGFFDQSHLAKHFKKICGMTPRQYRDQYFIEQTEVVKK
ncbi:helix-turn-helix transcriptional regulator [Marinomonas mediterranea]|jgi:AraC-type DNA-binding domain-containing proteins|uniref:Transcriptional regulator, AraC family n=1 Tax=Marinomonas mediterranea (strain ATCC 700492 / JCM 21426 / NBRC 103028 / MMB-1) TaxID=717774 RepID=F2JVQ4_MARM1|nr:helix-turn-helix transcriptional regulator [Marinomonas mediterranea]ADZ91690.1 transcriptional regulator, AraC family [Marinomonas mediterranea MMB-1]WCN09641.1 helix-turn-helix domain-containing protein [Marinomonas mediterranea]WCN13730.1 helix-turn-helix domain-containing protein [Marinomonas mediterranea]WCN17786.1 helix-turn-helix domain-containing protein [Marinomonas mediterranea MMB-1]